MRDITIHTTVHYLTTKDEHSDRRNLILIC
jgi:hypothetical protein